MLIINKKLHSAAIFIIRRAALLLILVSTLLFGAVGHAPAMPGSAPLRYLPEKVKKYADWIAKNDDFCGWLNIPGTVMDYPVVYGPDYFFYVDNDFYKKPSKKGAVFTDYRNPPADPGQNLILYAHNMKDGSMFGNLKKFNDLSFLRKNPVFTYDTMYGKQRYQVFAVLIVPMDYLHTQVRFKTPEDFKTFTEHMRSISLFTTDLEIYENDEMITLSTCWYDFEDARFVVQAVRLPEGMEKIQAEYDVNKNREKYW